MQQPQPWDIPAAISLYNIDRWGAGYFGINEAGNVQSFPTQDTSTPIDFMDVVAEAKAQGAGAEFPDGASLSRPAAQSRGDDQ